MPVVRNILFIMCDQLRMDYLSTYGNPTLKTPNIDRLAALGTKFTHCYAQAAVCGPSRMSFYTGRYVFSHGATWNFVPLPIGEKTLGDYMREAGLQTAVVGKTHAAANVRAIQELGISAESGVGLLIAEAGFEPYARHDGVVLTHKKDEADNSYQHFLRSAGYGGANPWHEFANSGVNEDGSLASGWHMRNAQLPARIRQADSETAWTTDRAIDFIQGQGEAPWCLHVSYIKPHWPYIAPAPYHALFGPEDCMTPVRAESERNDGHPVYRAFRRHAESIAFSRDEVRRTVVPAYMGLVKQIDDNIGRLLSYLERFGRMSDTIIVFTSDHGDFLGDHWLGEKELLFEQSVRIPLVIVDPTQEAVSGQTCDALVQAIDLIPTFLDVLGKPIPDHVLEGKSLLPLLYGGLTNNRSAVYAELDYAFYDASRDLGVKPRDARAVMVRTKDWKLVHYDGFPPQVYDLVNDPMELEDCGENPSASKRRNELYGLLFDWMRERKNRVALTDAASMTLSNRMKAREILIGQW